MTAPANRTLALFHQDQLTFRPRYEWAFGRKLEHPERTERADNILAALRAAPDHFEVRAPRQKPHEEVARQHAANLLRLYRSAEALDAEETYYPTVFLRREGVETNPDNLNHAGYYCFDAGTPLAHEVLQAALWSGACALEAAQRLRDDDLDLIYALSRPPGHHAGADSFGGYCYLNNTALAVEALRPRGRVAVLDIDFHHGNGTQSLYWCDPEVLTVSIHGDPRITFPFFVGYESEKGGGVGRGCNVNVTIPAETDGALYDEALMRRAVPAVRAFEPATLVVAAGVDTYELDPVGHCRLTTQDLHHVGRRIGQLRLPTCVVQEGGYYTPHIGRNVCALLSGLRDGLA